MDYRPRYAQPFTLGEATMLDVSTISEEIARLQNSLKYLRVTQEQLKEALGSPPDRDVAQAIDENDAVIGSQEERITILRLALSHKGVLPASAAHYSLDVPTSTAASAPSNQPFRRSEMQADTAVDDGEGVYL